MAANSQKNIAETVRDIIEPYVIKQGCKLWDVEYVREGPKQILRVTIDRDGGVDINNCEAVHRAIDPVLDETDPIPVAYYLEVSSPGLERELRLPQHFTEYIGAVVDVKLYTAVNGTKKLSGTLDSYNPEENNLVVGGSVLPADKISKVSVHFDFEN